MTEWMKRNKEHVKEYLRKYKEQNREYILQTYKNYYCKNKEKMLKQSKNYQKEHPEKNREVCQRWSKNHPEYKGTWYRKNKVKHLQKTKQYFQTNKIKMVKWRREVWNKKPEVIIAERCRQRIRLALKTTSSKKCFRTEKMLGCTWKEFKQYLESKFQPGMTWENKHLWHIDHIKPCASFDLVKKSEQLKCFHYTNLQPLWAKDNQEKHAKVNWIKLITA